LRLRSILQERKDKGGLSLPLKKCVLEELERTRGTDYTRTKLEDLHHKVKEEVKRLEAITGRENWILRLLIDKLKV
jgi:hypothetical protein